jgi:hypothetical protein
VESVGADKEQADHQGRQMAADRNDKTRANVSLQSDHIGCKSPSPPQTGSISSPADWYPAFLLASHFSIAGLRTFSGLQRARIRKSPRTATFFECTLECLLECLFKILHIVNRPYLLRHGNKAVAVLDVQAWLDIRASSQQS